MNNFMILVSYEEYVHAPQRWDAGPADKPDPGWYETKYVQCRNKEQVEAAMERYKTQNPVRYDCFKR